MRFISSFLSHISHTFLKQHPWAQQSININKMQDDLKQICDQQFVSLKNISEKEQNEGNNYLLTSEFKSAYQRDEPINFKQLKQKILNNGFYFEEGVFCKEARGKFLKIKNDSFEIEIGLGFLRTKISVLHVEMSSNFRQINYIGEGANAKVSVVNFFKKSFACKNILISKNNCSADLTSIYKEYFLAKIASILLIGPKIEQIYGYDLIIFVDGAEFAMELCEKNYENLTSIINNKIAEDLHQNLNIMHLFNIVHGDIKPDNIAYSSTYQRFVFIDFGISRILKEGIGFKSVTGFCGSFKYASDQMKKLLYLNQIKFVDLYYNDIHSLNITLKQVINYRSYFQPVTSFSFKADHETREFAWFLFIKFCLFKEDFHLVCEKFRNFSRLVKSAMKLFIEEFYSKRYHNDSVLENLLIRLKENIINAQPCEVDNALCSYLFRLYNGEFANKLFTVSNFANSYLNIDLIWQKDRKMDEILLFLSGQCLRPDLSDSKMKDEFELRKALVKKLYNHVNGEARAQMRFVSQFRAILLEFLNYYKQKKQIYFLQILRTLFTIIDDYPSCFEVERVLLQLYSGIEYYLKRVEFYLCHRLTHRLEISYNIQFKQQEKDLNEGREQEKNVANFFINFRENFEANNNFFSDLVYQNFPAFNDLLTVIENCGLPVNKNFIEDLREVLNILVLKNINFDRIENYHIKVVIAKSDRNYNSYLSKSEIFFKENLYLPHLTGFISTIKQHYQLSEAKLVYSEYLQIYQENLFYLDLSFWFHLSLSQNFELIQFCVFKFLTLFLENKPNHMGRNQLYHYLHILELILEMQIQIHFWNKKVPLLCEKLLEMLQGLEQDSKLLKLKQNQQIRFTLIRSCIHVFEGAVDECCSQFIRCARTLNIREEIKSEIMFFIVSILQSLCKFCQKTAHPEVQKILIEIYEISQQLDHYSFFSRLTDSSRTTVNIFLSADQEMKAFDLLYNLGRTFPTERQIQRSFNSFRLACIKFASSASLTTRLTAVQRICLLSSINKTSNYLVCFYYQLFVEMENFISNQQSIKLIKLIAYGVAEVKAAVERNKIVAFLYRQNRKIKKFESERKGNKCYKAEGIAKMNLSLWLKKMLNLIQRNVNIKKNHKVHDRLINSLRKVDFVMNFNILQFNRLISE